LLPFKKTSLARERTNVADVLANFETATIDSVLVTNREVANVNESSIELNPELRGTLASVTK